MTLVQAKCRGCGRRILWGVTQEGERVPLDPRPIVYHVTKRPPTGAVAIERATETYVSHHATCSRANVFNGAGKP